LKNFPMKKKIILMKKKAIFWIRGIIFN
jgi:hypothetical protein